MNRKRIAGHLPAALLCILMAMLCAFVPLLNACGEEVARTLTVGVPTDRCPMFYLDAETGEIAGIGADLLRFAAEEAGYSVTFVAIGEGTLKEALDNDAYDLVMPFGSDIASASGQATIVSDNLLRTPFTLVTANNRALPPLNNLRVGMLRSLGGAAETVQQLYPGMQIVFYASMDDCVKALRTGEVDALLHNSYVWSYVLQKPPYSDLKVQPSAMFSMDFRVGTLDTPGGRETISCLNRGIAAISEPRSQAVILDYTTRKLYRYDLLDYIRQYGLVVLLGLLLFIALAVIAVQRIHDVRAEQAEKMRQLIDRDPLTGVYSADGFRKRVEELIRMHPENQYMLSFANIKNFKFINDSLGNAAGDELLKFWASKTLEKLSDEEAMGRITGDRFAVLRLAEGNETPTLDDQTVIDSVRNYFVDRGYENRLQVCGGVYVLTPEDYREVNVDHMLDCARVAEKRVRGTRSDGYEFYNPEQWEKGKRTAEIISRLPEALKSGEISVWYQPQVNYDTGEITGAEALSRWDHAKLGAIGPTEFIPVLEEAGLIYDLDCFVWETVCRDLQKWNREGHHQSVSVNLSRYDIRDDQSILEHFTRLIRAYDLTPDQLRIEITETAYVENPVLLVQTTEKLRELGFRVEMDDFGSGYSSLHMLKELPVDRVKLDLYFLTETGDQERGRIIVSSMIRMGSSLGMEVIAEGVENENQAAFLHSAGCSEMQGYYFYKPMDVQAFEKVMAKETGSDDGQGR